MKITRMKAVFDGRAEGDCNGLPYQTELAGPDGISVVFWCGDRFDKGALQEAARRMVQRRDVVRVLASLGKPTSYYPGREDF